MSSFFFIERHLVNQRKVSQFCGDFESLLAKYSSCCEVMIGKQYEDCDDVAHNLIFAQSG